MPFLTAKRTLILKLESVRGTAETIGQADFDIQFRNIAFTPDIESYILKAATGRHTELGAVMGKRKVEFSASVDLRLGAAAGTAPKVGKAFKICGALETINAGTSVVYSPSAAKDEIAATALIQEIPVSGNALTYTFKGVMGDCEIVLDDLGQPLRADFKFMGAFVSVTDATAITPGTFDTSMPPAVIGSAISYNAVAQQIGKAKLSFGNKVELEMDPANATGYLAAYIATREPRFSMDPMKKLLATDPSYTRWSAGTQAAISMPSAAVGGIKWTVAAPKAQVLTSGEGERGGAGIYDQTFLLSESSGNDEWSLTQSA